MNIPSMNLNFYGSLPAEREKSKRAKAMTLTRFSRRPTSYYKSCNGESPFYSLCPHPVPCCHRLYISRKSGSSCCFPAQGRKGTVETPEVSHLRQDIAGISRPSLSRGYHLTISVFLPRKGKAVWIVAVWHSAQLPKDLNETEGTS